MEDRLLNFLSDIREIIEPYTQADPSFKTQRLFTRFRETQVRRQLIERKGYRNEDLPTQEVICQRLNQINYGLKRVAKIKPKKNSTNQR